MQRTSIIACLLLIVATLPVSTSGQDAVPVTPTSLGQAIVGFEPGQFPSKQVLDALPTVRIVADGGFIVVPAATVEEAAALVANLAGVAYVEDDLPMYASVTPNDPRYPNSGQYGPRMMGFPAAWDDAGYGSSDVVVAVLDTGIRRSHEDFEPGRVLAGYDYHNGDNNPEDDCTHGTHVSGTIAATTDNGKGVAGMSQATILPYKVLGPVGGLFSVQCSGSTSGIASAIHAARTSGADIVSMSIGGGSSTTMGNAVTQAWNAGLILVAAAGNDGASNSVDYPAAYPEVIAVAALTSSGSKASYSDMGSQVEISAPGSNVESTSDSSNAAYTTMSGTSMATPHVSGALALALSCDPSLTNSQLRSKMQSTAQDLGVSGRDPSYGFGLLDIDALIDDVGTCSGAGGGGGGNAAPTASLAYSTTGLTVSVDGSGSSDADGDALSYAWTFGDGGTATGATADHAYSGYGTYTITLTVDDGNGGTDSTSTSITLADPVDPDPSTPNLQNGVQTTYQLSSGQWTHKKIQVPSGATSLQVDMTGPGCGLTGCSLDGDLYVRAGSKPTTGSYDCRPYASGNAESCTFTSPSGWYYVSVHAYSGSGQVQVTATYDDPGPSNSPPSASFTKSTTGLTVSVDGSGSSDADGDALSYAWTFGDGGAATGATADHAYSGYGTYTITLTVDDGNGATDATSQTVTFSDPNNAPTAVIAYSITGRTVDFDATGSSDPDGDSLSYSWDLGDGTTSAAAQPQRTYAYGTYTATLSVDDGNGKSDTTSVTFTLVDDSDPDPGTANLQSGQQTQYSVTAGQWTHMKIHLAPGSDTLQVDMSGPSCGLFGCSMDADLYVREGAKPTTGSYDCRPYASGNAESCTLVGPVGWYYVSVYGYSGSGTVTVTATVS